MDTRHASANVFDYCISPRTVFHEGRQYVVPCGKCDGCLLHKANDWSLRLKSEIESARYSLWFTLTYNNKYLPTMHYDERQDAWISDHDKNVRFDSKKDVLRKDGFTISANADSFKRYVPRNFGKDGYFGYSSKRDFQLFLKLVRKLISDKFGDYESKQIRYFAISEYGPTTFRPHIHALLFCEDFEISSYLLEQGLYSCWQMCNRELFQQYTRFANSGASQYVTNYVTGFAKLPAFLTFEPFKPFRLSSKGKAVGFDSFNEEEFLRSVLDGNLTYTKSVPRLSSTFIFRYPKGYCSTLFPKAYRFSFISNRRLREVYGFLFDNVRRGCPLSVLLKRLRAFKHTSDAQAAKACYSFCERNGSTPDIYLMLLDMYYYKSEMSLLKHFYEFQTNVSSSPLEVLSLYGNVELLFADWLGTKSSQLEKTLSYFFEGFGIDLYSLEYSDLCNMMNYRSDQFTQYLREVEQIKEDCVKLAKSNEVLGFAPHDV